MVADDTRSDAAIQDGVSRQLLRAADRMVRVLTRRFDRFGVSSDEWLVLSELSGTERMMPSTLAERLAMSRGGVSRLIDRMVERGLVERTGDQLDRRAHWLSLSDAGKALLPQVRSAVAESEESFLAPLHPSEEKALRQLLAKVCRQD